MRRSPAGRKKGRARAAQLATQYEEELEQYERRLGRLGWIDDLMGWLELPCLLLELIAFVFSVF